MANRIPETSRMKLQIIQKRSYFENDRLILKSTLSDVEFNSCSIFYDNNAPFKVKQLCRLLWRYFGREITLTKEMGNIYADITHQEFELLKLDRGLKMFKI